MITVWKIGVMLSVFLEDGAVSLKNQRRPKVADGYALIRLLAAGICNTDLELRAGYYGFRGVPGHEFVGEVVECADAFWIGKRVCGEINLNCGKCEWCRAGLGRHCPVRKVLGIVDHPGAFREFLTLPARNLHEVPANVTTEHAVFVEPLAAACQILDQVKIPRGETVAVLGDGKLGLLIAQAMHARGIAVHHYGRHREKLKISEQQGIETRSGPKRPARAYEYVVEATGSSGGLAEAVQMARPCGTVVMKSTVHGTVGLDTAPVIVNELKLVGSRCGRFGPALDLLAKRKVNVTPMVTEILPLSQAVTAFTRAAQSGVLKILLRPD